MTVVSHCFVVLAFSSPHYSIAQVIYGGNRDADVSVTLNGKVLYREQRQQNNQWVFNAIEVLMLLMVVLITIVANANDSSQISVMEIRQCLPHFFSQLGELEVCFSNQFSTFAHKTVRPYAHSMIYHAPRF